MMKIGCLVKVEEIVKILMKIEFCTWLVWFEEMRRSQLESEEIACFSRFVAWKGSKY